MTESEIESAVIKVVAEKMDIDEDDISRDTRFTEDLNADSLDTVELVMDLEDEFEIAIGDEDAGKLQTIGDVVEFIAKHEISDRCSTGPTDRIAGIVAASRSIGRSGHEVDRLGVNGRMPTSRCIILVGLDDQSRSVVESCLPNDQFKITPVDPESGNEPHHDPVRRERVPR